MPEQPLQAPLAHAYVAFTIECDNEAEHRIPHWTTISGKVQGVWLVSTTMWWNCMRYVSEEPISVKELERRARTKTNLAGMQRWGYVNVDAAKMIRATSKGLGARAIWTPLAAEIEERWRERFGAPAIDRLRAALYAVGDRIELDLPDCLPILGYGLFSIGPDRKREGPVERGLPLSVLLARVLLAFAIDFERGFGLSLAICANVLAILEEKGVRQRDLPSRTGVSKEGIAMAIGILTRQRLAAVEKDPAAARAPFIRLTPGGVAAQALWRARVANIEKQWEERFGTHAVVELRAAFRPFTPEVLLRGMEPYPENWRAAVRMPEVLPQYPMVLHRGGYPDGS